MKLPFHPFLKFFDKNKSKIGSEKFFLHKAYKNMAFVKRMAYN